MTLNYLKKTGNDKRRETGADPAFLILSMKFKKNA